MVTFLPGYGPPKLRYHTLPTELNKLSDLQTPLRHHYIKQNQTYHQLSENRLKHLDQFDDRLDNALRVLPDLRLRRDLSAADTVTAVVKLLLKQAARYALDSSHTSAHGHPDQQRSTRFP